MLPGVSFDDKHCFDTYGLLLAQKEIGVPEAQTNNISVPGRDGSLDMTEALSGEVHYKDRPITLTLKTCEHLSGRNWAQLLSDVANDIHGRRMKIIFDDDPDWYYDGRCEIDEFQTSKAAQIITIICTCDPYKYTQEGEKSL